MSTAAVAPFPWDRLPRVEQVAREARRELFALLHAALDPARVGAALSQLLGDDVEVLSARLRERALSAAGDDPSLDSITVQFPALGLRLTLEAEPDLARACVARLLEQDFELGWADTGLDAPLRGATAALVLEVARRASRGEAPVLSTQPGVALDAWTLSGQVTLRLGAKPYRLDAVVARLEARPRVELPRPPVGLGRLGAVRLAVPWVSALSSATLAVLDRLEVGDVWMPGVRGWVGGEPWLGGLLAPPRSAWGLPVRAQAGRTVLGADAARMPEELEASMSQEEAELEQIVGETPLVVRLEVGALEMSAAEWAALRPGDVIQTGRRIEEPVILRAHGHEIARGELVTIEGEIGVRITQVGSRATP